MNLLGEREFIGACSSESEGLQQPIKVSQPSGVDPRSAERHGRANGRIEHPGGNDDRHTWCCLNDDDLPSRSPLGVELPDLAPMQRVPAIMNLYLSVDMGRMAPRSLSIGKTRCSRAVTAGPVIGRLH
jgi:hypothetical protein